MDWNILIGFGGLFIAGLSIYLSYKSQTASYRTKIYEKQIKIYSELFDGFDSFHRFMKDYIFKKKLNDKTKQEMSKLICASKEYKNFHNLHKKWCIFLPSEIGKSINNYIQLLKGISALPKDYHKYPKEVVYSKDPVSLLVDSHLDVFVSVRKYLGVETLGKETLRLFRKK